MREFHLKLLLLSLFLKCHHTGSTGWLPICRTTLNQLWLPLVSLHFTTHYILKDEFKKIIKCYETQQNQRGEGHLHLRRKTFVPDEKKSTPICMFIKQILLSWQTCTELVCKIPNQTIKQSNVKKKLNI